MKVHFVVPPAQKPVDRIYGCNYAFFLQHNVILLSIATLLRDNGIEVEITDCLIDGVGEVSEIEDSADVYAFYSVALTRQLDLNAAASLRSYCKPLVFMGPDPTWEPEAYLIDQLDYVVRGEPEYTNLELLRTIEQGKGIEGVKGVSYRRNGLIVHNDTRGYIENLDVLPIPDRDILKHPLRYFNAQFKQSPQTTLLTSRGCAHRCYYCVPNSLSYARELESKRYQGKKPPVKLRSAENVIEELEIIHALGYRGIKVIDDQFVWSKERTLKICQALKRLGFETMCLARADKLLDRGVVRALAEANVKSIDLGIESFDAEILEYIRKDIDPSIYETVIRNLRDFGIEPEINILLGSCPLETKETIQETWEKVRELDVEIIHAKVCAAFPGTDFYYEAKENGWITTEDYIPHDASKETHTTYPHLPKEYLENTVKRLYREHYFSPRYLFKQLSKIRSFTEFRNKVRAAWRVFTR